MKKRFALLLALCLIFTVAAEPVSAALSVEDGRTLLETYYEREIPQEVLDKGTLEEILEALDDPYTVYMSEEQYQGLVDATNGSRFVGIGAVLRKPDEKGAEIDSVLPGSPAKEAGLQRGDRIVAVDGVPVKPEDSMADLLGGPEGTEVRLTVAAKPYGERKDVTLTRREVHAPTAAYELIGDSGYIECASFGNNTAPIFKEALELLDGDAASWIVDMRSNPGGTTDAVADCVKLFTDERTLGYFRDNTKSYIKLVMADRPAVTDKPVIVMTSPQTASGAEIFTAAVRDYELGIAVGQRSFGKGIAQVILDATTHPDMFDSDSLKLTKYRVFYPGGNCGQTVGVLPAILMSEKNTAAAAVLLSGPAPTRAGDYLKLKMGGQEFYINIEEAQSEDFREAFAELLEALPPAAELFIRTQGRAWKPISPEEAAGELGISCSFRTFPDLTFSPYRREIDTLAAYQLVSGEGDGKFHPDQSVTRAEFCAMLTSALALKAPKATPRFSDLRETDWYAKPVGAMNRAGFISGPGDGTIRPDEAITYEQALTVLSNVAVRVSRQADLIDRSELYAEDWCKWVDFSGWARKPARNLDELGVIRDPLTPGVPITREQAAALVCRTLEAVGLLWDTPAHVG